MAHLMAHQKSFFLFHAVRAKIILVLLLIIIADWLFFKQPFGWTIGLYAGLAFSALCIAHKKLFASTAAKIIATGLVTLIAPLIISPRMLTCICFITGMMMLVVLNKRKAFPDISLLLADMFVFGLKAVMTGWYKDFSSIRRIRKTRGPAKLEIMRFISFTLLPLGLTLVFGILFSQANPIIARNIPRINLATLLCLLSPFRLAFWLFSGSIIWAFLRPRFLLAQKSTPDHAYPDLGKWVTRNSIVYSLIVFNTMFAVQNILDISFLWHSGGTLPEGLTHAEYARAGAYPLVFTTLLAAAYVLVIFNAHQQRYHTMAAKNLVLFWIAQNIFLTISAIYRTTQYIETYSLTHLRIAALLWMTLVIAGLILIIIKVCQGKSNSWLVNCNILCAGIMVYFCCFFPFNRIIADYNVRHSLEAVAANLPLDLEYMESLGPEALPALRWFHANANFSVLKKIEADALRARLENELTHEAARGWRAWTWQKRFILNGINQAPASDAATLDKRGSTIEK